MLKKRDRYIQRYLSPSIEKALKAFPCVFINGPRQAGKTTLAKHLKWASGHAQYVNFDDVATIAIASQSPQSFLSGFDGPVILDEIQMVPEIFRALKIMIDERREIENKPSGMYVLTGSANILAIPQLADALVGRMIVKTLYPLAAVEICSGKHDFISSLSNGMFKAGKIENYDLVSVMQKATFPEIHDSGNDERTEWFSSYVTTLIQRDVKQIAEIEKATLLPQLLNLLASRIGGLINEADLARSVKENAVTTKRYLSILQLLFLTLSIPPWFKNLGKRIIKSPKGYLIDVNLACHMLRQDLKAIEKNDPILFGHLVENFVAVELLKQIGKPLEQASLYHFRTGDGKEVDFVIEFPHQKVAGIEVKTTDSITLQDCAGLLELQSLTTDDFIVGVVLYRGNHILKMKDKIWALPLSMLWR